MNDQFIKGREDVTTDDVSHDEVLERFEVQMFLDRLPPERRMVVELRTELVGAPADWPYAWPPSYQTIGAYVGLKYRGKALAASTTRHMYLTSIDMLKGVYCDKRLKPEGRKTPARKRKNRKVSLKQPKVDDLFG